MAIFSKNFDDLMTHITREYAGKKMKSFLNVSPLKIIDILLSVFLVSSLYLIKTKINSKLNFPEIALFCKTNQHRKKAKVLNF